LGLAAGNLLTEATARGLSVHQMIGIVPEKVREVFGVPEGVEPWTALAIGYPAEASAAPEALRQRDTAPRARKPLREFVFGERFGQPADLVKR
jgi:nitroreductase